MLNVVPELAVKFDKFILTEYVSLPAFALFNVPVSTWLLLKVAPCPPTKPVKYALIEVLGIVTEVLPLYVVKIVPPVQLLQDNALGVIEAPENVDGSM